MSNQNNGSTPWDDERITAYVMGELTGNEKQAFEDAMQSDLELADAVDQARLVTSKLAGFYAAIPGQALDPGRRDAVLASPADGATSTTGSQTASTTTPSGTATAHASTSKFTWTHFFVAASLVGILAALSLPVLSSLNDSVRPVAMQDSETGMESRFESLDAPKNETADTVDASAGADPFSASQTAASSMRRSGTERLNEEVDLPMNEMLSDVTVDSLSVEETESDDYGMIASDKKLSLGSRVAPESAIRAAPQSAIASDRAWSLGESDGADSAPSDRARPASKPQPVQHPKAPSPMPAMEQEMYLAVPAKPEGKSLPSTNAAEREQLERQDAFAFGGMNMNMDMDMGMGMGNRPQVSRGALGREAGGLERSKEQKDSIRELDLDDEVAQSDFRPDQGVGPGMSGDKYDVLVENTFKRVADHQLSTLSIDVDTASYSKVRMFLQRGQLPRPDAVRIEEMINYFHYDYDQVAEGSKDPFAANLAVAECPWNTDHRLVRVGLQAIDLDKKERPQCNLVFLIDTSGSMRSRNKLPLVIDGMKLLLDELRPDDQVAIVVYAGSAGLVLDSTPVSDRSTILQALTQLQAGGSTNGGAGMKLAYQTAREHFIKKGVNRVVLCSDGDFNVGMTGTDELVREAKSQAKSGIDLTVLGFGMGNHNDAMMERISNDAEGNYGFIDTINEAKKVLVKELTGTLVTVAKDVKIQIEFNPQVVSSYRLIGYENRLLAKEDFNDDKKDAGEIGAGHRVTALYEIVPTGKLPDVISPAVDPLKYQADGTESDSKPVEDAQPAANDEDAEGESEEAERVRQSDTEIQPSNKEMLTLKLRYKPPQGKTSTLMTRVLMDSKEDFAEADTDFQFAAAVAGFGMQLRNSTLAGNWTYDDVLHTAEKSKGEDEEGSRAEMIELIKQAQRLTVSE
ncbi:Ca-activated chloride channel family protein [Neorhodopirellula lusitana]|uniref:Ca-activated chloride channel family protein n=1 Tax=Neorhodopirellula lusitana TaxID=445327 RepID=A0ABY1QPW2_9BACT|nr:von Willebrand factor type A domain-containing protein [Neorhodopirellula lusitana]SMP75330.1 Ca-activated chloride channel family protein [Neorhodopirellula lusitana]